MEAEEVHLPKAGEEAHLPMEAEEAHPPKEEDLLHQTPVKESRKTVMLPQRVAAPSVWKAFGPLVRRVCFQNEAAML
jgi:hypothetical protein